jgi:hypothetical protein
MPAMRTPLLVLPLGLGLVACGGGDSLSGGENFTGMYQVTLHQRNTSAGPDPIACTDFGPDVTGEEQYFQIVVDDFFDDPNILEMHPCMTDPGTCDDFGFVHFDAHGDYLQEDGWSVQTDSGCAASAIRHYGVFVDATTLRIEEKDWYQTFDDPDCPLDLAEGLLDTPDCDRNEAWEGTRL